MLLTPRENSGCGVYDFHNEENDGKPRTFDEWCLTDKMNFKWGLCLFTEHSLHGINIAQIIKGV